MNLRQYSGEESRAAETRYQVLYFGRKKYKMLCQHFCSFCFSNVENVSGRERYRPLPSLWRNTGSLQELFRNLQVNQKRKSSLFRLQLELVNIFYFEYKIYSVLSLSKMEKQFITQSPAILRLIYKM